MWLPGIGLNGSLLFSYMGCCRLTNKTEKMTKLSILVIAGGLRSLCALLVKFCGSFEIRRRLFCFHAGSDDVRLSTG